MCSQSQTSALAILLAIAAMSAVGCHELGANGDDGPWPFQSQSIQGQATWTYWESLRQIYAEHELGDSEKEPECLAEVIVNAQRCRTDSHEIARNIWNLPIHNVAPEAVEVAASSIHLLEDTADLCWELEVWASGTEEFSTRSESIETMVESFFRGLGGDPLGTYNDLNGEAKSLNQQHRHLQQKFVELQNRASEAEANAFRVRAQLSAKFNCEFSSLD